MSKDCWSQYVIVLKGDDSYYGKNTNKTFTLLMPRSWPESLNLHDDLEDIRKRLAMKFDVSLLLQIEISDKTKENKQYFEIRDFIKNSLENYFISPVNAGLWNLPEKEMMDCLLKLFYNNAYDVVFVRGDWKSDFISLLD
jgi:hypothetical protein